MFKGGALSEFAMTIWGLFLISTICRCDARPDNLDAPGARRRTHETTDFLLSAWDPGILWTDFGVRADLVVRSLAFQHRLP